MLCGSGTVQGYRRIQAKNDCWFNMLHPSLVKFQLPCPLLTFKVHMLLGGSSSSPLCAGSKVRTPVVEDQLLLGRGIFNNIL
jgi:hypothetical protein